MYLSGARLSIQRQLQQHTLLLWPCWQEILIDCYTAVWQSNTGNAMMAALFYLIFDFASF